MISTKRFGRLARSTAPTARALTEFRVWQLVRDSRFRDLALCQQHAAPGTTAVDVGASVGNYALAMSKAVGRRGHVLALEANPSVFRELELSTWGSRVTALNLAASNENGTARMLVPHGAGGGAQEPLATLEARPTQVGDEFEVKCVQLDTLLTPAEPVSLIKIDVEGHEAMVIEGARGTIDDSRPVFVIEIEDRHLNGRGVGSVVELLLELGYNCLGIHGAVLIPWTEFDVAERQLAHLSDDGASIRSGRDGQYVNNFLFIPSTANSSA